MRRSGPIIEAGQVVAQQALFGQVHCALFSKTADCFERIAWGFVNLFHRAASRKSSRLDRAERHHIQQLVFNLDRRLGARAGFKRNGQMLDLDPRCVIAFPGNDVLERLVIAAKARRITFVDQRNLLASISETNSGP